MTVKTDTLERYKRAVKYQQTRFNSHGKPMSVGDACKLAGISQVWFYKIRKSGIVDSARNAV